VIFFIAFLNSPCYETPRTFFIAIKKTEPEPNNRGRKKKTDEKKVTFFVMSPDGFFRVFELPGYETPKKRVKKIDDKNKNKIKIE
jgi:hypothetical protein